MSDKESEIFILCEKLAELLGNKEAIADLRKLYNHHPEMFKDMQEVSKVINEVVQEPEIISDATHSNKDKGIYKVARKLDSKKMGDVVIKNDNGTNVIFHANKKKIEEFERLLRQVKTGGRFAHFLHPDLKSAWAGFKKHSPASNIIPQSPNNDEETYMIPNQNTSNTHFITQDSISNLSLEEQISLAKENQKTLNSMPKASDIDKDINKDNTQDTTQRVETQSQNSIRRMK